MRYSTSRLTNNSVNVTNAAYEMPISHSNVTLNGCRPIPDDNSTVCAHGCTCCCPMCHMDNMYKYSQEELRLENDLSFESLVTEEDTLPLRRIEDSHWGIYGTTSTSGGGGSSNWWTTLTTNNTVTVNSSSTYDTTDYRLSTYGRMQYSDAPPTQPRYLKLGEEDLPDDDF